MNHSGYITVDFKGLELNSAEAQTISGLFDRAKEAIATGKPAYAVNCKMNGGVTVPISVTAWYEDANTIIATGHVLRITIPKNNSVTVTNLITANRSVSSTAKTSK